MLIALPCSLDRVRTVVTDSLLLSFLFERERPKYPIDSLTREKIACKRRTEISTLEREREIVVANPTETVSRDFITDLYSN